MDLHRAVTRKLHEEHEVTLALVGQLEGALGRARVADGPPADPTVRALLARLADDLEREIARHFDFEERTLFPVLGAAGEPDIAELLTEEHQVIRDAARPLVVLAQAASRSELNRSDWPRLRAGLLEIAERLVGHVQKEEMALLPALEDLLTEEQDAAALVAAQS